MGNNQIINNELAEEIIKNTDVLKTNISQLGTTKVVEYNGEKYVVLVKDYISKYQQSCKNNAYIREILGAKKVNMPKVIGCYATDKKDVYYVVKQFVPGKSMFEISYDIYARNKRGATKNEYVENYMERQISLGSLDSNVMFKFFRQVMLFQTKGIPMPTLADSYIVDRETGVSFIDIDANDISLEQVDYNSFIKYFNKAMEHIITVVKSGYDAILRDAHVETLENLELIKENNAIIFSNIARSIEDFQRQSIKNKNGFNFNVAEEIVRIFNQNDEIKYMCGDLLTDYHKGQIINDDCTFTNI